MVDDYDRQRWFNQIVQFYKQEHISRFGGMALRDIVMHE